MHSGPQNIWDFLHETITKLKPEGTGKGVLENIQAKTAGSQSSSPWLWSPLVGYTECRKGWLTFRESGKGKPEEIMKSWNLDAGFSQSRDFGFL